MLKVKAVTSLIFTIILFTSTFSFSQGPVETPLIEKLGYSSNDKLLIVHVDDLGLNHSTNQAAITAFKKGTINSASIMVPTPAFDEIALFSKQNPHFDMGLHITFTSEWQSIRWGGIAPSDKISSLLDKDGYFYASTADFVKHANIVEVEIEYRAQIEQAIKSGIAPSHIDTHMGALFQSEALFSLYVKLGREYKIPVVLPLNFIANAAPYMALLNSNEQGIDNYYILGMGVTAGQWSNIYNGFIDNIKAPEVSQVVFHLGFDNTEMQHATDNAVDFGSAWRQRDFDYIDHPSFKKRLTDQKIQLITWKDIQRIMYPNIKADITP
jgi:predicted glycoside hydrolase/deacetylase ChbG (UPF0249 family)